MSKLTNYSSKKALLFYLCWTIAFAIIHLLVVQPEKLTIEIIALSFIISSVLSAFLLPLFFKSFNTQSTASEEIEFHLSDKEKLILRTNANLKKQILLLGGCLILTDKSVIFIGTEFFNKNKQLIKLPLRCIKESKCVNNRLFIMDNSCNGYLFLFKQALEFHNKLNNLIS